MNAANPRRCEQHGLGSMLIEPAIDCGLVTQVNATAVQSERLAFLLRKPAYQRRTHHAAVTGDEYPASIQRKDCRRHVSIHSRDRRTPCPSCKTGLLHGLLPAREVDVVRHHHSY